MTHEFKYTANGVFGIHTLTVSLNVEDNMTIDEINTKLMEQSVIRGYTSILGFNSIDDNKTATMIFAPGLRDHDALGREVFHILDHIAGCKKEIAGLPDEGFDMRRDFLNRKVNEYLLELRSMHKALELVGIDVDDRQSKHQILTNLGFYRTNI